MKSLRQLRTDLLGLRLSATGVSLWEIQATVTERANRAINDAIATYEMHVQAVWTSLNLSNSASVVALPADVGRIVRIEAVQNSVYSGETRRLIQAYDHVPTPQTNLLYLNEVAMYEQAQNYEHAEVLYETIQRELPGDLAVIGAQLDTFMGVGAGFSLGGVRATGGNPAALWKAPGFFELSIPYTATPGATTSIREVVRYEVALPGGFTGLQRAVDGMLWHWTQGALISAVYEAPETTLPVIADKAQAVMYEFWVRNRAVYDQYTAIASEQALSVGDLLGLSRAMEDKADRAYKRIKRPPLPTRARIRIREHE